MIKSVDVVSLESTQVIRLLPNIEYVQVSETAFIVALSWLAYGIGLQFETEDDDDDGRRVPA